MDLSAGCASDAKKRPSEKIVLCAENTIFPDAILHTLRMVSVHGEALLFGVKSGISSIRRAFGGCLGTRRR